MATETQSTPTPPELTSWQRVNSIPVLKDSLAWADQTLANNTYTHAAYNTAQAFSQSAYKVSAPIQVRLAPLIVRADGIANKGLDVVQARYPHAFEVPTDEVLNNLKAQSEAYQQAFDTRVKNPAYGLVEKVDSQFTPLVDRFEVAVQKLHVRDEPSEDSASSSSDASTASTSQLTRAYRLSVDLRNQVLTLSAEQVKQLRAQNALVQRAFETVETLSANLTSTFSSAQEKSVTFGKETSAKVQEVTQNLQQEVEKLQSATKQLPSQIQPYRDALHATIADLSQIVQAPGVPVSEKVAQIGATVQHKVAPALKALREALEERGLIAKPKEEAAAPAPAPTATEEAAPPAAEPTAESAPEPVAKSTEESN